MIKKQRKAIFAAFLSVIFIITGIPMYPNTGVQEAFADTSLDINPAKISTVYGGQTKIVWSYDDPGEATEHPTDISLYDDDNSGKIGDMISGKSYPVTKKNTYVWDGKLNHKPQKEDQYTIRVIPTDWPDHGNNGAFEIFNPNPPAPVYMEILPDPKSDSHIIHGVAELGTHITLMMTATKRIDDKLVDEDPVILAKDIEVKKQRTWSADKPIEATYFTDFPLRDDNQPEDYVGEWEVRVTLPAYQIAHITAFATRDYDGKKSVASKEMQVLRFKAPSWG